MTWTCCNCEELDRHVQGSFELCLCVGLLYHLENPIRCLRQIASRCTEMIVLETQVCDELVGQRDELRAEIDAQASKLRHESAIERKAVREALALKPEPHEVHELPPSHS